MRAGDLVFVRGDSWVSPIITWFDEGEFSHVAIAVSDTEVLEAQRFTKSRIVPMTYANYEIVSLPLNEAERTLLSDKAKELEGYGYDYLQIVWYMVRKFFSHKGKSPWNDPKKVICSEIVSRLLYAIGWLEESDTLYERTPNELYAFIGEYVKSRVHLSDIP
jgi:hypothetical protein